MRNDDDDETKQENKTKQKMRLDTALNHEPLLI
jgi:hypothetical protein